MGQTVARVATRQERRIPDAEDHPFAWAGATWTVLRSTGHGRAATDGWIAAFNR
jgi:predicted nucleic acid-binding protein